MSIIRNSPGPEEHYQLLSNSFARDSRVTPRAARVYIYLRSHRTGWSTNVRRVAEALEMNPGTVNQAVNDLESLGYVERHQAVDEAGKFSGVEYVTHAEAIARESSEAAEDSASARVLENRTRENRERKNRERKNDTYKNTNSKKNNIKEDQGGLMGLSKHEATGLSTEQDSQSPPKSLDELAAMNAVAVADDVCPRHPHGNHDDVPCHGCRQVRVRQQQEAAQREAERKGAVVRELRKRNESYTPPTPPTVDKYPTGVAEIDCAGCGASSGEQCVRDGKPAMLPCGERLRAAKSRSVTG